MTDCWIGVASRDHVLTGVAGGFAQLCHGRQSAISRVQPGDWIAYYSPRSGMGSGEPVQAFTAIGEVQAGDPVQVEMGTGFRPFRRDVRFLACREAPIRPLLERLSFTANRPSWGQLFRRGAFRVPETDFRVIAEAMGVELVLAEGAARG
jgi:hypothetical protein